MTLTSFMTATCEHRNNPTGASSTSSVATGIPITPIDPAGESAQQAYPTEKYFLLKECFTKYEDFEPGDFLVSGGVTYAVRAVMPWAEQGGMDAYTHLVLEKTQRSR
jgi:hypothetical protein